MFTGQNPKYRNRTFFDQEDALSLSEQNQPGGAGAQPSFVDMVKQNLNGDYSTIMDFYQRSQPEIPQAQFDQGRSDRIQNALKYNLLGNAIANIFGGVMLSQGRDYFANQDTASPVMLQQLDKLDQQYFIDQREEVERRLRQQERENEMGVNLYLRQMQEDAAKNRFSEEMGYKRERDAVADEQWQAEQNRLATAAAGRNSLLLKQYNSGEKKRQGEVVESLRRSFGDLQQRERDLLRTRSTSFEGDPQYESLTNEILDIRDKMSDVNNRYMDAHQQWLGVEGFLPYQEQEEDLGQGTDYQGSNMLMRDEQGRIVIKTNNSSQRTVTQDSTKEVSENSLNTSNDYKNTDEYKLLNEAAVNGDQKAKDFLEWAEQQSQRLKAEQEAQDSVSQEVNGIVDAIDLPAPTKIWIKSGKGNIRALINLVNNMGDGNFKNMTKREVIERLTVLDQMQKGLDKARAAEIMSQMNLNTNAFPPQQQSPKIDSFLAGGG